MTIYCDYCNTEYNEWIQFEVLNPSSENNELVELVKDAICPFYCKSCAGPKLKILKLEKDIEKTKKELSIIQRDEKNLKFRLKELENLKTDLEWYLFPLRWNIEH